MPSGTVTFVMTDIEGSTRLFRDLDETYVDVLQDHRRLLRTAFDAHHGHEVGTEGDSLFVAFQTAADALAACVDAQLALAAHAWPGGADVRVRIGVHTGEARPVGERGYVSLTVHQLARISAAAHGGQILLSEATVAAAGSALPPGTTVVPLGSFRLRGFPAPEPLFQLRHRELPGEFPPLRAIGVVAHNLPFLRTSFVGRTAERAALADLLTVTGVVTVAGMGGVGKTRLATQVAFDVMDRYPDGAWLVGFESLTDPRLVARQVALALDVSEQPGRAMEDVLVEALAGKRSLLLLDSCEHVLGAVARLAQRLAHGAPHLAVLATSREPLDIEGETVWRLDPMPTSPVERASPDTTEAVPDAVRLFEERARLVQPGFELDSGAPADVADLVGRLDGIPLAVELAAAALAERPLSAVIDGLADRFDLLTTGRRTAHDRHQTMRAALEWSLDLLDPRERRCFTRLGAFAGGWTSASAAQVCGFEPLAGSDVPVILRRLARASLLRAHAEIHDRWSMVDTVRELAALELAGSGEGEATAARHRAWYLAQAEQAESALGRTGQTDVMPRLVADQDNLRLAIDTAVAAGDVAVALRLCVALAPFWTSHGDWSEGWARLEAALDLPGGDGRLRGPALVALANLLLLRGELPAAADRFEQGRALGAAGGDELTTARALAGLGYIAFRRSRLDEAERHWRDGLETAQRVGDERVESGILRSLAIAAASRGDQDGAGELLDGAIAMARRVHDDELLRLALAGSAEWYLWLGRYDEAERRYGDALDLATGIGDLSARPVLLAELGWVALLRGDPRTAHRLGAEAAELAEDLGNRRILVHALRLGGEADARLGAGADACAALERALAVAQELGAPAETAGVRCSQACVAVEERRWSEAREHAEAALEPSALSHPMRRASPHWALGVVALAEGDLEAAGACFRKDLALADQAKAPRHEANGRWGLARVGLAAGRPGEAASEFRRALELRRRIGDRLGVADCLVGVAALAGREDPVAAAQLVGASAAARTEAGAVATTREGGEAEAVMVAVAREVGADEAAAQRRAGESLEVGRATGLALDLCARLASAGGGGAARSQSEAAPEDGDRRRGVRSQSEAGA